MAVQKYKIATAIISMHAKVLQKVALLQGGLSTVLYCTVQWSNAFTKRVQLEKYFLSKNI